MSNETTDLALVPLHPGCINKKEPVVKVFPLVLGRTNLANWWWNSCPCEKYCRLHCKPVAQNIRSLSKVMLMVDSKAQMKAVGKNPHLITVTPERTNHVLRENDIVSIGRRDREPWMRFQVVQANGSSNRRRSRRRERRRHSADGQTRTVDIGRLNMNPPEWITTTTRKRKMSRISTTIPEPSNTPTQQNAMNPDYQKRRRKRLRDSSFRLGSRPFDDTNSNIRVEKYLQTGGQNQAAHHMHLVVQDYKNSAMLLESDRERRKEMSERSVAESQSGRLHGGRLPFVCKKIQEDVDERTPPVEEAIQSPEAIHKETTKEQSEVQRQLYVSQPPSRDEKDTTVGPPSTQPADEQLDQPHQEQLKDSGGDEWMNEGQPDSILVWSAPNQFDNGEVTRDLTEETKKDEVAVIAKKGAEEVGLSETNASAVANTRTFEGSNHPMTLSAKEAESSIMNMPAVGSTFEGTIHASRLSPANRSSNRSVQYSDAELQYWQQIAKGKPGKVSDFRRAMACLIIAKNRGKEQGDPMWLPDLLDDE